MKRAFLLAALAIILCLGWATVASAAPTAPYSSNSDCTFCHDVDTGVGAVTRVEFDVPAAMRTRCNSCHSMYHWNHYNYANTCQGCHDQRPNVYAAFPPPGFWDRAKGFFVSEASLSASPTTIHSVHVNGSRWENDFDEIDGMVCAPCHAPAACSACHGNDVQPGHANHTGGTYPAVTYSQGDGISRYVATTTCVNASCHNLAKAGTQQFVPTCSSCHPARVNDHGYDAVQHTADVTETVDGGGKVCGDCHSMVLLDEHTRDSSSSKDAFCGNCHAQPRGTFGAWDQTCSQGGCHAVATSAEPHSAIATSHTVSGAAEAQVCVDCHEGDLAAVHINAVASGDPSKTSCLVCHSRTSVPATNNCTTCHFTYDAHPYPQAAHESDSTLANCGGSGCHSTRDLLGAHQEKNPAYVCNDCHNSPRAAVQDSIANGSTSCSSCHTGVSDTVGHRAQHAAVPALVEGGLPQYAFLTGSEPGGAYTSACASCHTSNLIDAHLGAVDPDTGANLFEPQKDFFGAALTCASCHDSTDPYVVAGISPGVPGETTKCDQCHKNTLTGAPGVHGAINQLHTSTFVDSPQVKCTPCHTDNLVDQHNGGLTAIGGDGRVLAYCDICHDNYGGTRGPVVQAAIEVTNDVRCSACHSATHPDFDSHSASSAASLECGSCHAAGQSSIEVKGIHAGASAGPCAVCHDNPARVPDIRNETAECASCHAAEGSDYHRNFAAAHGAPDSQACVDCHETADVVVLHAETAGNGCVVCHDNAPRVPTLPSSTACVNCHSDLSPADPDHYPAAAHAANDGTESGFACSACHKLEMKPEHAKASSGAVACVQCHETKVDAFTGPWDDTCDACHAPRHTEKAAKHASSTTECSGAGCHAVADVAALHSAASTTVAGETFSSCAVCHRDSDAVPTTTTCTDCHDGHGDLAAAHTAVASVGCTSCHETGDVREIHPACTTCHDGRVLPANTDCTNCHSELSPADPSHYAATPHRANDASQYGYACSACHKLEMRPEHVKASSGAVSCVECHETKVDGLGGPWDKSCADCHGSQHGDISVKHASSTTECSGAGCHAVSDVGSLHSSAATTVAGVTYTACRVCHRNDDSVPATTACRDCHDGHGDITARHTAVASGACTACHETGDVRAIHPACTTCHSGAPTPNDVECVNCHGALSPVDPNHYPTASHASAETTCNQCHYGDLKQEHFKTTSGPVSCVQCHETKVDGLASPWNDLCMTQCHATKHGDQSVKHVSNNTTCGGTGCHAIGDVSSIHQALPGSGCSACHKSPSQPATTTNCSTSGCHDGVTGNHHAMHDTTGAIDVGCKGCHFTYLDDEHAALGYTCATCHSSTNPAVAGAITANDRNCLTCHPDSAHNARQAAEFAPSNASMHRVSAGLPGMRSSFVVNGATYTMSLPSASSFLKSGYAVDSVVTCNMCHTYSGSTGPHGATMKVNIDPAYPNSYRATGGGSGSTAQLSRNSPTGMSMSSGGSSVAKVICEKCHDLNGTSGSFSNIVHSEHDDRGREGGYCNHCHVSIPHGWGRPRLLGYTTDSAAYRTTTGGLQRISLKNYTPSSWAKADCGAGCSSSRHPVSGSSWPNAFALGSVTGRVLDTLGNAVSGATVTISGGGSATTGPDGRYTIIGVSAGSVSVTAAKTGYTSQTKTATVNAAQATSLDFSLTPQPVATNLARNKSATASSQYSSSYSAAKAVDGSTSTYWQSSSGGTQWLQVDLGSSQSLSKVVVNWNGSYYAKAYRIQTSSDGSSWTQRYSTTYGTSGTKTHSFDAVSARYVRVYCTSANSSSYRLNEFEVWNF